MNNGYIKLHRKILNDPIFLNPGLLQLFLYCLLRSNHNEQEFNQRKKTIIIKRGTFLCGLKKLSEYLHCNQNTLYKRLQTLKSLRYIDIQTTNKFSIISIVNYEKYQNRNSKNRAENGKNKIVKKTEKSKNKIHLESIENKEVTGTDIPKGKNKVSVKTEKSKTNKNIYNILSKERSYIYSVVKLLLHYTNKEKSYCFAITNRLLKYKAADNDISKLQKCLMLMYVIKKYCDKTNDPKYIGILTNSYRELSYTDFKRIVFEQPCISDLFESKNLYSLT